MNTIGIISMALIFFNLMTATPNLGNEKALVPEDISAYPIYENLLYSQKEAFGLKKDGKYGFLDLKGNELIPFMYESAGSFSEGLAPVSIDGKFGYINLKNEIMIPFEYDNADLFKDEYAIVEKKGKSGVIDKNGNIKIPIIHSSLSNEYYTASHKVFEVCENQKYGLLDTNGNTIIPVKYDTLTNGDMAKTNTFLVAKSGNKFGVLDYSGNILLPFEYDYMEVCGEKTVSVKKYEKCAVLDIYGNIIAPYSDKGYGPIGEGFFTRGSIFDEEGVALLNSEGKVILPESIAFPIRAYSSGYIKILYQDGVSICNFDGNIVTTSDYNNFISAENGYFHIIKNNGTHGIWKDGKETLFPCEITNIFGVDNVGNVYAGNSKLERVYVFSPKGELLRCFEGTKIWSFENFYLIESGEIMKETYKLVPKNK